MQSVSIAGATGLVGSRILSALPATSAVTAWVRRPVPLPSHAKSVVSSGIPDPDDDFWKSRTMFLALGTTIAKAGSREAFESIDLELVVECARRAQAGGCETLALVSASMADPASRIFYNRVKGLAEREVSGLGFPRTLIARPSLLLGGRKEFRLGERIAVSVLGPWRFLLPRSIRPVRDIEVASAMVEAASDPGWSGSRILRNRDLLGGIDRRSVGRM